MRKTNVKNMIIKIFLWTIYLTVSSTIFLVGLNKVVVTTDPVRCDVISIITGLTMTFLLLILAAILDSMDE